jgi:hypothetical protein
VVIFTINVDAENQCLINHKCICGARNPAFWVGAVIASGSCPPSLQTIVSIEFLCHCRVGCALRFLFFIALEKKIEITHFFIVFIGVRDCFAVLFWVGEVEALPDFSSGCAYTCVMAIYNTP